MKNKIKKSIGNLGLALFSMLAINKSIVLEDNRFDEPTLNMVSIISHMSHSDRRKDYSKQSRWYQ